MNLLLLGLVNTGKTTIAKSLCKHNTWNYFSIDSLRKKYSDGSHAGEDLTWSYFLRAVRTPPGPKNIFEFSGVGDNKHAVMEGIKKSKQQWKTIYCIASQKTLQERNHIYNKKLKEIQTPYGDSHFDDITLEQIIRLYDSNYYQTPQKFIKTDNRPLNDTIKEILDFIELEN